MPGVYLQLLGRFQVLRDGTEIPPAAFGGRKVRALLRVLAVRTPDLVTHEVLAEALWPDRLPADPAANLGVLVNRARRALGDPGLVITGSGGYALGNCTVDVAEFLAALDRARAAADDHTAALRAASEALRLWGEPLAEDTYADWAREPRERLQRLRVDAAECAARAAFALGDPRRAASWAADAVAAEPLRESAVLVLADALAAAGDPAGALTRLATLQQRLADELGVDPSPLVGALRLTLLRNEHQSNPRVPVSLPVRKFGEPPLTGRSDELARLRATVETGGVATLSGVAGMGKSRLLAELTRRPPLPVLSACAFLPERAEAWGLARSLLREAFAVDAGVAEGLPPRVHQALADLLPELGDGPREVLDGESQRALLLAGAVRVLESAAGDGAVLVVDDLQWSDPSSLLLIGSALARLPRLAAVLAFRPDELSSAALAGLRGARTGDDIVLTPLTPDAVEQLVSDATLAAAILHTTDGTPFAITELLRELVNRGVLVPAPEGGWRPRSPQDAALAATLGQQGHQRAVRRQAAQQTGLRGEVLAMIALLAREAPASTVAHACGRDPREVLDVLTGLAAAGLVRLGERGWATSHDLVAEIVTADLDRGRSGRLHCLLAAALAAEDADPSEIARHHRDGGDPAAAARTFVQAAAGALAAHATREAVALADEGLALNPRPSLQADLFATRADASAAHGDPAAAADLRSALAATAPGPIRARRLARLAMLTFGSSDPHHASELAELALVEAAGAGVARAIALETAAILDMNLDRPDRARERSEAALELYQSLGDGAGVARILDSRAMATFLDGAITRAVTVFGRVAQLFTDSGELLRVITPRSTRGHGFVFAARPADGLAEITSALRLARELDAREGQAYALWHRSEALSALHRADEALADAQDALSIARGIGHRGWTATALRALGIAHQAGSDPDAAATAFTASARTAADSLTLFASWAAARSALVAITIGRLDHAQTFVDRALSIGPPLGHYEGRLAAVELLAARGDRRTASTAAAALAAARQGGHAVSAHRLAELAANPA